MKNRSGDEANDEPSSFLAAAIYLPSFCCLRNSENTMFVIHNQNLVDSIIVNLQNSFEKTFIVVRSCCVGL